MKKFLMTTYKLQALKRYNNVFRIKDESVAEHSYFVSLIVLKLHQKYNFKLEKALKMAITHDLPEIFLSDIPLNVKNKFNGIKKLLDVYEIDVWKSNFPEFYKINKELLKHKSIEAKIVKFADLMSCYQYSKVEVGLGNKGYMLDVLKYSKKEMNRISKHIKKYKK